MLNEVENLPQTTDKDTQEELNEAIDTSIAVLPLNKQEKQIVADIVNASDQQELERQFDLFNVNQSKKNALRVIKLNTLLGKIEDQAIRRFEKRPDQISNKELLEFMQVVANQIDRSQKYIDTLKDKPMIKVTDKSQNVNINIGTELNRDSKERVIDAIQALLKQLDKTAVEEDIIEADTAETTDNSAADVLNSEEGEE